MTEISIIIPVHELDNYTKELFQKAVKSVEQQKMLPNELIIVIPSGNTELIKYLKEYDFGMIKNITKIIYNEGKTDFQSQVNLGVEMANSKWVSFLELDDEMANIYLKNVDTYVQAYPNTGIFMPIIVDTDKDGNFIGFTNESVWAHGFTEELGILDLNALLAYQNFNIDGIVMKKEDFIDNGGFKSNIKLTFIYEFLLRMAFKDIRIMVIPRFGYKHMNQRPDSLFDGYRTMDAIETKWWLNQSKKEYYFDNDREITYEK